MQFLLSSPLHFSLHGVRIVISKNDGVVEVYCDVWTHSYIPELLRLSRAYELLILELNANAGEVVELFHHYQVRLLLQRLVVPGVDQVGQLAEQGHYFLPGAHVIVCQIQLWVILVRDGTAAHDG